MKYTDVYIFPFGEHDDLLDAAATGTAYLLDRPEPRVFCLWRCSRSASATICSTRREWSQPRVR